VYGFIQPKPNSYDYEIVSSRTRKVKALWNYYKGVYYKIPFTYPPEPIEGVIIPGLGSPEDEYRENRYDLKSKKFIDRSLGLLKKEIKQLKKLWSTDWRIFACVFRITDMFQHYHWGNLEVLKKAYTRIDDFIGWVMERKQDNILMVVSDHGFCFTDKCFCINTWLNHMGYLHLPVAKETLTYKLILFIKNSPFRHLALKLLARPFFGKYIKNLPLGGFDIVKNIDERTTAYYVPGSGVSITINKKGRQPRGKVSEADYEAVRNKLMKYLSREEPVKEVHKADGKLYDILIVLNEGWIFRSHDKDNKIFKGMDTGVNGTHTQDGIFISNLKEPLHSVYEVTPKIKELLGEDATYYAPIRDSSAFL